MTDPIPRPSTATAGGTSVTRILKLTGIPLIATAVIAAWPDESLEASAVVTTPSTRADTADVLETARELAKRLPQAEFMAEKGFAPARLVDGVDLSSPFRENATANAKTLSNGTAPVGNGSQATATAAAPPEVSAVVATGDGGIAWVGGRRVTVGDEVDGFRIVAIDDDGVAVVPATPRAAAAD